MTDFCKYCNNKAAHIVEIEGNKTFFCRFCLDKENKRLRNNKQLVLKPIWSDLNILGEQ